MEQLVIGKYPSDSFCLWDGDELIARTAIFIFSSPEDMLLQLKIALIAYKRGNHLPYLYVNTGIKLLLKHVYKYKPKNYSHNDLKLIRIAYKMVNNSNIGKLKEIYFKFNLTPLDHQPSGRMNLSRIPNPGNSISDDYYGNIFNNNEQSENEKPVRWNLSSIMPKSNLNFCNII